MTGGNMNTTHDLENIKKMIEKTKPKRADGIELIINTDEETAKQSEDEKKETRK